MRKWNGNAARRNEHAAARRRLIRHCGARGGMLALLVLLGIGIAAEVQTEEAQQQKSKRRETARQESVGAAKADAHLAMIARYTDERPPDQWWLEKVPGTDLPDALRKEAGRRAKTALEQLKRYRHVSPLAGEIADTFSALTPRIYFQKGSLALSAADELSIFRPGVELCFVPRESAEKEDSPPIYYWPLWRAQIELALEMPEAVAAALRFHDLGHAMEEERRRREPPPLRHDPSRLLRRNAEEEIVMHELEMSILSAASSGAFLHEIDTFIWRKPEARTPQELIFMLSLDDLRELDRAVGCAACGPTIARILVQQYVMAIGLRKLGNSGRDTLEEKVAFYDWILREY